MKKCAVFNDLSGFGKCSLMACIPILSVMGIETHPVPTAVLTNQTGYKTYSMKDLGSFMTNFIDDWENERFSFNGILTGCVGDHSQFKTIHEFIDKFKNEGTILVVDPVMADNNELYAGYDKLKCEEVRRLSMRADIITPNVTELSVLIGEEYSEDYDTVCAYASEFAKESGSTVIVTGLRKEDNIINLIRGNSFSLDIPARAFYGSFSGTGDIFSAVLTGSILRCETIESAVKKATAFLEHVLAATESKNYNNGVNFELFLGELI